MCPRYLPTIYLPILAVTATLRKFVPISLKPRFSIFCASFKFLIYLNWFIQKKWTSLLDAPTKKLSDTYEHFFLCFVDFLSSINDSICSTNYEFHFKYHHFNQISTNYVWQRDKFLLSKILLFFKNSWDFLPYFWHLRFT